MSNVEVKDLGTSLSIVLSVISSKSWRQEI